MKFGDDLCDPVVMWVGKETVASGILWIRQGIGFGEVEVEVTICS